MYTHIWRTAVNMTVKIPENYEPKQIEHAFKIGRDVNKIQLFYIGHGSGGDEFSSDLGFFYEIGKLPVKVIVKHNGTTVKNDNLSFNDPNNLVTFEKDNNNSYRFIIKRIKTGTTDVRVNVKDSSGKTTFEMIRLTVK